MSRISESNERARIPEAVLLRPVFGVGLSPGTLADQIVSERTLFVFLRHFGCIFCREAIADIRAAEEADPDYPDVLFFFQGSATEGRVFLRRYWPRARAVADPELELYDAFGVGRASLLEGLGPKCFERLAGQSPKGILTDLGPGIFGACPESSR